MGPGVKHSKRDLQTSSSARADGEQELLLCNARLSQMQARLLATLDEADALRDMHKRELETEKRAKDKLSTKLDRYLDELKRAEAERDEMREVVSILVEKVEKCNDYSAWPYSRMSLARPLEPLNTLEEADRRSERDTDFTHSALLQYMQKQLEDEKRAHSRTKEEADAEILRLSAMVARRDAELEACATHSGHRVLLSSRSSDVTSNAPTTCRRSNCVTGWMRYGDEAISGVSNPQLAEQYGEEDRIFAQTVVRQRTLEREVKSLHGQLQDVQTQQLGTNPCAVASPPIPITISKPSMGAALAASPNMLGSLPRRTPGLDEHLLSSPQLRPHVVTISPSPYVLTPGNGYTPTGVRTPSGSHVHHEAMQKPTLNLDALRQQIDLLSAEITAFGSENDALKRMLAKALPHDDSASRPSVLWHTAKPVQDAGVSPSLPQEHDCARETQALRRDFDEFARQSSQREKALQTEIDTLRQALFDPHMREREDDDETRCAPSGTLPLSPTLPPIPPVSNAIIPTVGLDAVQKTVYEELREDKRPGAVELADGSGELDEQSMELATPLHPTILSLADEDLVIPPVLPSLQSSSSTRIEPADVPLPVSPDSLPTNSHHPPLTFQAPSPPQLSNLPHSSQSLSPPLPDVKSLCVSPDLLVRVENSIQARVNALEHEYAATQRKLDEKTRELVGKNAAIAGLRNTTSWLHAQIAESAAGTDADGDGDGRARGAPSHEQEQGFVWGGRAHGDGGDTAAAGSKPPSLR